MMRRLPRRLPIPLALVAGSLVSAAAAAPPYGPVARGEMLSAIAHRLRPDPTRESTWQTAVALYRGNPQAFIDGAADRLRRGSVLAVPDAAAIRAVDPLLAHAFARDPAAARAMLATQPAAVASAGPLEMRADPAVAAPPAMAVEERAAPAATADTTPMRRRPGAAPEAVPASAPLPDPNRLSRLAPVAAPPLDVTPTQMPISDRWRVLDSLGLMPQNRWDPYHQNALKGDKPVRNGDEFFTLSVISDSVYEPRRLPTPVGPQGTSDSGSIDVFGEGEQTVLNENLAVALVYLKGDTTFRPPDWEYHFTPVFNVNRVISREARALRVDPRDGATRDDAFIGVQELFADYHLRNVSERYDFDSVRIGIQPFSSDFRGFLFQDNQLAVRLFGTRDNNRWQYNLAWIRRLEKDTNSGLNDVGTTIRNDNLYVFNLYRQDFPLPGFTSQGLIAWNENHETRPYYNENGFLERPASFGAERPRTYDVAYVGYNGDGHFGWLNLTGSLYGAFGRESEGVFHDGARDIAAGFAAFEASVDRDWLRWRLSLLWTSADRDPYDGSANGYDAVFENPIFAGADTSFWIRQPVPLIGGGGVALSTRNGMIADLRSSKDHGQSNFANPGTQLAGLGADLDLLPELRVSFNANHLWFGDTRVLEIARQQAGIARDIGWDLSVATIWRPFFSQNVVVRLSGAWLLPGAGFEALYPGQTPYSVLANVILAY